MNFTAVGAANKRLRIGIAMDGLREQSRNGQTQIANGGVGVYTYNLVKHLRQIDSKHEYCLIHFGASQLDIFNSSRGRDVCLPDSTWNFFVRHLDWPYWRVARRLGLDLLHYPNQFGGAFLPKRFKRVVTLHDLTPLIFPAFHPRRRALAFRVLMRRALGAADYVMVDSVYTMNDLLSRRLAAPNRIAAIPLAAADTFRPGLRSKAFCSHYSLPEEFILTVGVFEPRKNHATLVRALDRLHHAGAKVGLVLVGRPGWKWNDPIAETGLAYLRPFVKIVESVPDEDLAEFYNRAAVFALPSFYEGFGLPILESMACGTPVVASKTSSLPEVGGNAALYIDPNDAEALAASLLRVLREPGLREQMAEKSLARARQFSWRRLAQSTLEIYERVCASA